MSVQRRCDICDVGYGVWKQKEKFSLYKFLPFQVNEEMDFCDTCVYKFRKWVRENKVDKQ